MATLAVELDCITGGFTRVTLCMSVERTGSDNDRYKMRMVRRITGSADVILPGTPEFVMGASEDVKSWTWIDPNIPADGAYTYALQVYRISGLGVFNEMVLTAEHFKK